MSEKKCLTSKELEFYGKIFEEYAYESVFINKKPKVMQISLVKTYMKDHTSVDHGIIEQVVKKASSPSEGEEMTLKRFCFVAQQIGWYQKYNNLEVDMRSYVKKHKTTLLATFKEPEKQEEVKKEDNDDFEELDKTILVNNQTEVQKINQVSKVEKIDNKEKHRLRAQPKVEEEVKEISATLSQMTSLSISDQPFDQQNNSQKLPSPQTDLKQDFKIDVNLGGGGGSSDSQSNKSNGSTSMKFDEGDSFESSKQNKQQKDIISQSTSQHKREGSQSTLLNASQTSGQSYSRSQIAKSMQQQQLQKVDLYATELPKEEPIEVKIVSSEQISEGWTSSYWVYEIETKASHYPFKSGIVYRVVRRFSEFVRFYEYLKEKESYKGYPIPPLPPKTMNVFQNAQVIEQRKQELQNFLKILTLHKQLHKDQVLFLFLTEQDLSDVLSNPSRYMKAIDVCRNSMPNELSMDMVKAVINLQMKGKNIEEPECLRPIKRVNTGDQGEGKQIIQRVNLEQLSNEIQSNVNILSEVRDKLQAQHSMLEKSALQTTKINTLMVSIKNLEYQHGSNDEEEMKSLQIMTDLSKNRSVESNDGSSGGSSLHHASSSDFEMVSNNGGGGATPENAGDLLDKNRITQIQAAMFGVTPQEEPTKKCEIYLKEKIAHLRGLLEAIQDRSRMVHGYTIKSALKEQKLTSMSTAGVAEIDRLQNDVDDLTHQIESDRRSIEALNQRLLGDIKLTDERLEMQIRKLIMNYSWETENKTFQLQSIYSY